MICNTANKCGKMSSCDKYCVKFIGRSLYNYLNGLKTVSCKIGMLTDPGNIDPSQYYVVGIVINTKNVADYNIVLLRDKCERKQEAVFNGVNDINIYDVLSRYLVETGGDNSVIDQLKRLFDRKELPLVLGVGQKLHYVGWESSKKGNKQQVEIAELIYVIDNDEKELRHNLKLKSVDKDDKTEKVVCIDSIGDNLLLDDTEDIEVLKIRSDGVVLPIIIKSGLESVAIDGTYAYSDGVVIGEWKNGALNMTKKIKNEAISKYLSSVESTIAQFRHLIAPYLLAEGNEITL